MEGLRNQRNTLSVTIMKLDGCLTRLNEGKGVKKAATEARSELLAIRKLVNEMRDDILKMTKPAPESKAEAPNAVELHSCATEVVSPIAADEQPIDPPFEKLVTFEVGVDTIPTVDTSAPESDTTLPKAPEPTGELSSIDRPPAPLGKRRGRVSKLV